MEKIHSEWFWSKQSAQRAAAKLEKKGYATNQISGPAPTSEEALSAWRTNGCTAQWLLKFSRVTA